MPQLRVAVVCVADCTTKYLYQSLRLVASVAALESRHEMTCLVGYFDGAPGYFIDLLHRIGAETIRLDRYCEVHGPSNKMAILKLPQLDAFDVVIMCDCDVIFVEAFDDLLERDGFQAKIADQKSLPEDILRNVFRLAAKPFPEARYRTSLDDAPTILYCNAGLLIFSANILRAFVARWFWWNDVLLRNRRVMERFDFFIDQASLCLTAEEFAGAFHELSIEMNYPVHLPERLYSPEVRAVRAKIIHYHDAVEAASALLDLTQYETQHAGIAAFNRAFETNRELVSGPAFWDHLFLYLSAESERQRPFYQYRAGLAAQVMSSIAPSSVIDLGCGRAPLVRGIQVPSYTGIDVSSEAIAAARRLDSFGTYLQEDAATWHGGSADLVLLVDVLPYLRTLADVQATLAGAAKAARLALMVSGLEEAVDIWDRPHSFFHHPIADLLDACGGFSFTKIGSVGQQAFFLGRPTGTEASISFLKKRNKKLLSASRT